MRNHFLAASLLFTLSLGSINAEPVVVSRAPAKVAAAIALRSASPTSVMWGLDLFSVHDFGSAATWVWRADRPKTSPSTGPSLPGIDLVAACDSDSVLLVYGERAAVDKLKDTVAALDVVRRQVQVKAEVVALGLDEAKKLGIGEDLAAGTNETQWVNDLRASLRGSGAEMLGSPVLTTLDGVPGEIAISSGPRSIRLCALPKINADGTVTLQVDLSMRDVPVETGAERKQSIFTQRRLADGGSVVLGGFCYRTDEVRTMVVLLTVNVVN